MKNITILYFRVRMTLEAFKDNVENVKRPR